MKTKLILRLSIANLMILLTLGVNAQVTTATLLQEMIDLKSLAELPSPNFTTHQFSSYDRHSISPDQTGWFGNQDGFGHETIPGFEKVLEEPDEDGIGRYLICDVKGPGAMVRIWTAWIIGDLEVYLDGNEEPLYNGLAQDFIYKTYDAIAGTEGKYEQEGVFFQNTAGYYPIPFRDGIKMIWTGKIEDLHFYHLQLRMYEEDTEVQTFSMNDLDEYGTEIAAVFEILEDPLKYEHPEGKTLILKKSILPGNEYSIFKSKGKGAISFLGIKLGAEDMTEALRQSILKIYFDGASSPQVQTPVGDFFGAAPGINPYKSLPLSVLPDGSMICNFYMPYKDSVEIVIQNLGGQKMNVDASILTEPYEWTEKSMYFRARWRIDHGLSANYKPSQDIPYLMANGKGVMVGAAAYIYNPTSVPSSWGNWWGEGDEKIFIDQGSFPAFFGTGSEDYFNYAWSSSAIFTHPYCGQPRNDGPANRGFVTNYRWHILDKIPFNTGLAFFMELMSHEAVEDFSYGRMVYLYGRPGMYDDNMNITYEDVELPKPPENWQPVGRKGSNNAAFFQAEDIIKKNERFDFDKSHIWSGDMILVWEPESKKDELILEIETDEAGEYVVVFTLGKDKQGGQFTFSHDGKELELRGSTVVDTFDPYRVLSRNYSSDKLQLRQGVNEFIIRPTEENEGKMKVDFIWLMKR